MADGAAPTTGQVVGAFSAVMDDIATALEVTELAPLARGGQKFVLRCLAAGAPAVAKVLLAPGPGQQAAAAMDAAAREARLLAAVDSPRVPRLLRGPAELRFDGVVPYGAAWAEEFLDGEDVAELLKQTWTVAEVSLLAVHLAEGLRDLHSRGIAHRDVNPANVRRRGDGGYALMDLGGARRLDEPDTAGRLMAVAQYRSPEHEAGARVGPASDVYGFGLVLRDVLGRVPPGTQVPGVFGAVLERCLQEAPERRFGDGAELLAELGRHLGHHPRVFGEGGAGAGSDIGPDPLTEPFPGFQDRGGGPDDGRQAEAVLAYLGPAHGPVLIRGAFGERRVEVEAIAANQEPFAVRLRQRTSPLAAGADVTARTVEFGAGRVANVFQTHADVARVRLRAHSDPAGFHLVDLFSGRPPGPAAPLAAVSGSFSFISDEPGYQPAEPSLDLCVRGGALACLPTAAKPALLVGRAGPPRIRTVDARGTVIVGDRAFGWIGSKERARAEDRRRLTVFGAANCSLSYRRSARTGATRYVERAGNTTPPDPDAVDLVVGRADPESDPCSDPGLVVRAVRAGGGTDLFEGCFILRGRSAAVAGIRVGDAVTVPEVDGIPVSELDSALSIGPSLHAAASGGPLPGYDESLGYPPFLAGQRYARTIIGVQDGVLRLWVIDGAPLSRTFQGVSSLEAAGLAEADGLDPRLHFHLDGGQSAKVALNFGPNGIGVYGSMHYTLWPQDGAGTFEWRGRQGRVLRSAVVVYEG